MTIMKTLRRIILTSAACALVLCGAAYGKSPASQEESYPLTGQKDSVGTVLPAYTETNIQNQTEYMPVKPETKSFAESFFEVFSAIFSVITLSGLIIFLIALEIVVFHKFFEIMDE